MNIVISGASGFIGKRLSEYLSGKGFRVTALKREYFNSEPAALQKIIDASDVIINLAGAPINKRWSVKHKKEILNSRIHTTRAIVNAISEARHKPVLFISASAVGIYDENKVCSEDTPVTGNTFLKEVCILWENEALKAKTCCNVAICRLGVVLDAKGGALSKLLPLFKAGLGATLGNGRQMMSWIHIYDLLEAINFMIENRLSGTFNLTAPNPVSNRVFSKTLGSVLRRPSFMFVPRIFLKPVFNGAEEVVLGSIAAIPSRLTEAGFRFRFATIQEALQNMLAM